MHVDLQKFFKLIFKKIEHNKNDNNKLYKSSFYFFFFFLEVFVQKFVQVYPNDL